MAVNAARRAGKAWNFLLDLGVGFRSCRPSLVNRSARSAEAVDGPQNRGNTRHGEQSDEACRLQNITGDGRSTATTRSSTTIGASANTENFDTTASAKKTTSPEMFAGETRQARRQEEQRPEHERREARVGRDERGVGGDVRLDRVADERDHRRPKPSHMQAQRNTRMPRPTPISPIMNRAGYSDQSPPVEVEEFLAVRISIQAQRTGTVRSTVARSTFAPIARSGSAAHMRGRGGCSGSTR